MWEWTLTSGMSLVCTQSIGFPTYCLAEEDWLDTLATSLLLYPLWCTNIPLIFDGTVGKLWQSFSYFEVLFCEILPRCDEKGEGEASKHSESVVQPASIKCFPLFESNHQIHYSFKSPEYWRVNLDVGQLHQALQASVSKIVFNCWENHSGSEMYCNCPDELCEN